MSASAEKIDRIRNLDWSGLRNFWNGILSGETPGWPAGKALEHLVLRAFELDGAEIAWPFEVEISGEKVEQIDGVVYIESLSCILECKDTADRVNTEPIAKLRNQLLRRPSGILGSVINKNGFTDSAITLSRFLAPQAILLWDGNEIGAALQKETISSVLREKYRYLVENAIPYFRVTEITEEDIP